MLGGDSLILGTLISGNHAYQGGGLAFAGNECMSDAEDCQLASVKIPRDGGTRIFGNSAVLSGGGVLVQAWRNTTADPEEVAAASSANRAFTADDVAMPPLALSWPPGQPTPKLSDYASRLQRWQGVLPLAVRVTGPSSASVMGVRLQVQVRPVVADTSNRRRQLLQAAVANGTASKAPAGGKPRPAISVANITLLGGECVSNARGIANFSTVQFKVRAPPGDYLLKIFAPDYPEVGSLTAPMKVRSCVVGEVRGASDDTCEQCATETWSRNPENATCDACVAHATCKAAALAPVAGYWHSVPESVQIHSCPNPEACQDGGVCAAGYEGTL